MHLFKKLIQKKIYKFGYTALHPPEIYKNHSWRPPSLKLVELTPGQLLLKLTRLFSWHP